MQKRKRPQPDKQATDRKGGDKTQKKAFGEPKALQGILSAYSTLN